MGAITRSARGGSGGKPVILLYGNCQAEALQHFAHFIPVLRDWVTVKVIALHVVHEHEWAGRFGDAFFSDVAVLWNQVEGGEPTFHRQKLESRIRDDWAVVKFPPFSAMCPWPFMGHDPRQAGATDYTYPWSDSVAASLDAADLSDDALFDTYMRISAERMPDLERRLRLDVTRWRASDALADIAVADWVAARFRTTRLFYTAGHLTALPLGHMLKELLRRTPILPEAVVAQACAEVDLILVHHRGQDLEVAPVHPMVAERLGLTWHDPAALGRWRGHAWSFREYILNYIRWEPYLD